MLEMEDGETCTDISELTLRSTYSLPSKVDNSHTTQLRLPEFARWLVANSCNW